MPLSKYDRYFGGQEGSAAKAKSAMTEHYGVEKGEQVFYATKNKKRSQGEAKKAPRYKRRHEQEQE